MDDPEPWTQTDTQAYLQQLCDQAQISSKIQAKVGLEDVFNLALYKLIQADENGKGLSQISQVAAKKAYIRETLNNVLADQHRQYVQTNKRSVNKEVGEGAFGQGHSPDSAPDFGQVLHAPDTSPSQGAAKREEVELIHQEMTRLPADQKRALEFHLQGLKVAQIAVEMGKTPDAIQSLIFRATMAMRSRILRDGA